MPKFFVPPELLQDSRIALTGAHADHMKVLRLRAGEEVCLSDGLGRDYTCEFEALSGGTAWLRRISDRPSPGEPRVAVTLYCGLPKGDKAEHIIQKAVELGAAGVTFFLSSRCVSRPDEKSLAGKLRRWNKLAEEAAMQSYRGRIPELRCLPSFEALLRDAACAELRCFLWEGERERSLQRALSEAGCFSNAALITGPEGGFSETEAAAADKAGIRPVTLGPRILRCETAPLAALSALMYHCGEFAYPANG